MHSIITPVGTGYLKPAHRHGNAGTAQNAGAALQHETLQRMNRQQRAAEYGQYFSKSRAIIVAARCRKLLVAAADKQDGSSQERYL
jgi:hypothetical protein